MSDPSPSETRTESAAVTDLAAGLTTPAAAARLERFGPNAVAEMQSRQMLALLGRFWGVIPWMLELALVLDLVLGRWIEAAVIATLLCANAFLGFAQEQRAKDALAVLRKRLTVNARVRRDGAWRTLPAAEIVPDDVVHVRVGDIVPADVRITQGTLSVDQSQMTGESAAVEHTAGSTIYAGSPVRRGEATGIVTATGKATFYGRTAELIREAEPPRRLEALVVKIASYLGLLVLILAMVAFATMVYRGTPLAEMLPFGLMLLVTSVPMGLPMMFTMSAALGARGLAESGILVTRLAAIEDAASMDVLCLDKTGTLTENRLTVESVSPVAPVTSAELLGLAALASDHATQDPIDLAILQAAGAKGLAENQPPRLEFEPFDPTTRRSEALVTIDGHPVRVIKGAPATIAELTGMPWSTISADVDRLSAAGGRVLAVATGPQSGLTFAGLIALGDPPREDAAALISSMKLQGVRVVLVTGDGEATARALAAKVGITGEVAPAGTLRAGGDAAAAIRYDVFAGVFPEEKFFLIKSLQDAGHMVGMTGDGVNDAPALRQADIGIAVAGATDVAKSAASLVLTKPGLGEIIMAIDGSRRIFQRMRSFVLTMISMKLSTPVFLASGVIVLDTFMLTPLQIVLHMLLNTFVTMSVSMDQVAPSTKPDRWAIGPLMAAGAGLAALSLSLDFAVFWAAGNLFHLDPAQRQTLIFFWLIIGAGQASLYVTRGRGFFWERPYPGRIHLMVTVVEIALVALLVTRGWLMAPVPPLLIGGLLILVVAYLFTADMLKIGLTWLARQADQPNPVTQGET
jgi:H+-transporting ATPase